MGDDVLSALKRELAEHRSAEKIAANAARELELAIAAIERSRSSMATRTTRQNPIRRGQLSNAILQLIAEGRGLRATMESDLRELGLPTNGNSISNALNRLSRKGEIKYDSKTGRYSALSGTLRSVERFQNAESPAL
jgi:hypothetical protein